MKIFQSTFNPLRNCLKSEAGLRFYKIRFYKIQHNSIQHNCVYVVVYVCRNACVWVFYVVETNLVERKACLISSS